MVEPNECPECGRVPPADAPRGLCPGCLLNQGLANDDLESLGVLPDAKSAGSFSISNRLELNPIPLLRTSLRDAEPGCDPHNPRMSSSDPTESPRDSGRYQLFGEIARGGMGAIIRGHDRDLGRDLAMKVLLEHHRDQPELVRRFIEEARIGGQLQHPGIVPVHELGTLADRRPYFTMKLVIGRTLAALLAARTQPDEDRTRFLGIFEQVCQTMSYAHARGVIHRDLKPNNVMVGRFGEVQVMDWGLAKVLRAGEAADEPLFERATSNGVSTCRDGSSEDASRVGSVLGTPAYMAPEQARGEIDCLDERVDVFGLGAILCEVLTGHPPYLAHSAHQVHELAAGADLSGAWRRLSACGADLELVALTRRCLSPLPRDRPRDASEVCSSLSEYLHRVQERLKQAELARVEAVAKAFEERTKRRLAVGLATALVLLMTTLGVGGSWVAWDRQRRAARFEVALRGFAVRKAEAETAGDDPAKWAMARDAASRVEQLFDDARNGAARSQVVALVADLKEKANAATTDGKLLDTLAKVGDSADEAPYQQTESAYVAAFRDAGLDIDGRSPEELGSAIARRPERVAVAVTAAQDRWAALRRIHGDRPGSTRLSAISRTADPDAWRTQLRLTLAEPDRNARLATLRELVQSTDPAKLPPITLALLGDGLLRAGDPTAAEAILRPAQRQYPGDLRLSLALAQTLENLSRRPEAIRYYMMARAIRPESAHRLAHLLEQERESDEAIAVFRDLIRLDPTIARHYSCLGKALLSRGETDQAQAIFDQGVGVGREAVRLAPNDPFAHVVLGTVLDRRGWVDAAAAAYETAIRLKPDYDVAHRNLGIARQRQGRLNDAVAELREAIRLEPHEHLSHSALAFALRSLGRADEAVTELEETVRLKPNEFEAHFNLGIALFHRGRQSDALAEYREVIRLNPDFAEAHYDAADVLGLTGQFDQAIAEYREAIRLKPDYAEAHCNLAFQLRSRGQYAESLTEFERGHELGSKRSRWTYPSAKWIEQARRLVQAERDLPSLLRGDSKPATNAARVEFAHVAHTQGFYVTSARLWAEVFALEPSLASDPAERLRFIAARCAILASRGKGKDQPPPDDDARAGLRRQAYEWLKADLASASHIIAAGRVPDRNVVYEMLRYWRLEGELAGIRDDDALAHLPAAEQAQWRALWKQVDDLLTKFRSGAKRQPDTHEK